MRQWLLPLAAFITAALPAYVHFEKVGIDRQAARDRATERRISNEYQIRTLEEDLMECLNAADSPTR